MRPRRTASTSLLNYFFIMILNITGVSILSGLHPLLKKAFWSLRAEISKTCVEYLTSGRVARNDRSLSVSLRRRAYFESFLSRQYASLYAA